MGGYEHYWSARLSSNAVFSRASTPEEDFYPPISTSNSTTPPSTFSTGSCRTARGPASSICTAVARSSAARTAPPIGFSSPFASTSRSVAIQEHASVTWSQGAFDGQDPAPKIDHFFSAVAARLDLWRDLSRAAQAWAASPASRGDAGLQAACNEALTALLPLEDFQAYPGARVLNAIKERVAGGDAMGTARLVQRVSSALMSRSYRSDAGEWEAEDDAAAAERAMPTATARRRRRPYFEVLFVTPTPPSRWPAHAQQIRKLRRPQDEFVYEPVFVGSFEDAALAVILNTNLESVVIYDGFPYASSRDVPLLKDVLSSRLSLDAKDRAAGDNGLLLAKLVKRFRPELDIILLADRKPEAMISQTRRPRASAASSTKSRSRSRSTSRSSRASPSATRRRSSTT